ncbi:MAG: NAD-dependent epimerase/dehydratase family protein [Pseudomonadota bacterium]
MTEEAIAPMKVLVTGIAGFIGFHVAQALSARGHTVTGVDSLTPYYGMGLKKARLSALDPAITFHETSVADRTAFGDLVGDQSPDVLVHLAAQPGVRHSIEHPFDYAEANLMGHLSVLEACRHSQSITHLVYASSSSVYGENSTAPFSEDEPAVDPVSLYAATKRADELMSSSYAHLYGLKQVGLRFFTVYGPLGRPDMAYWMFTQRIFDHEPIRVFNQGQMQRDMTYVDDVVAGVCATIERVPTFAADERSHRIYNVGNSRPERLMDMISTLETLIGHPAEKIMEPMQPGDVTETYADISRFQADYGYAPKTRMEDGLAAFVDWYRDWRTRA